MTAALKRLQPILGLPLERVPPLVVSFLVAETFFRFGSFGLECIAFLALWRALDWLQSTVLPWLSKEDR